MKSGGSQWAGQSISPSIYLAIASAYHTTIPYTYHIYIYVYLHYVLHAMRSAKARRIVDVQNLINYFIKIVFYWHSNLDFGNLRLYLALSLRIHIYLAMYSLLYTQMYACAIKLSVYIQFCLSYSLYLRPTRRTSNFNWFLTNLPAVGHRPLAPPLFQYACVRGFADF